MTDATAGVGSSVPVVGGGPVASTLVLFQPVAVAAAGGSASRRRHRGPLSSTGGGGNNSMTYQSRSHLHAVRSENTSRFAATAGEPEPSIDGTAATAPPESIICQGFTSSDDEDPSPPRSMTAALISPTGSRPPPPVTVTTAKFSDLRCSSLVTPTHGRGNAAAFGGLVWSPPPIERADHHFGLGGPAAVHTVVLPNALLDNKHYNAAAANTATSGGGDANAALRVTVSGGFDAASDDSPLLFASASVDDTVYSKMVAMLAAMRLFRRIDGHVQLAAEFLAQGKDLGSPAAAKIRSIGEDPAHWPTSVAVVEALRMRVHVVLAVCADFARTALFGLSAVHNWNKIVAVLRKHCATMPLFALGGASEGPAGFPRTSMGQLPPVDAIGVAWERVTPLSTSPTRTDPATDDPESGGWSEELGSSPPLVVAAAAGHTTGAGAVARSDGSPSIGLPAPPINVNHDDAPSCEWSDDDTSHRHGYGGGHSRASSHRPLISVEPTPTNASQTARRWQGTAADFIDLDIKRFNARRDFRLRAPPLPTTLSLTLHRRQSPTTQPECIERPPSQSWAQESVSSSFATSAHIGMDEVLPGLYCGSREPSEDMAQLDGNNIRHVVSCINTCPFAGSSSLSYTVLNMEDTEQQPLARDAETAYAAIYHHWLDGGENVLVHCGSGVSRAPAVLTYALCKLFAPDFNAVNATAVTRIGRPFIIMNSGFNHQLREAFPHAAGATPHTFGLGSPSAGTTPLGAAAAAAASLRLPAAPQLPPKREAPH